MTMRLFAALTGLLVLLAACGVDGEPERPEPRPAAAVAVGGSVSVDLSGAL